MPWLPSRGPRCVRARLRADYRQRAEQRVASEQTGAALPHCRPGVSKPSRCRSSKAMSCPSAPSRALTQRERRRGRPQRRGRDLQPPHDAGPTSSRLAAVAAPRATTIVWRDGMARGRTIRSRCLTGPSGCRGPSSLHPGARVFECLCGNWIERVSPSHTEMKHCSGPAMHLPRQRMNPPTHTPHCPTTHPVIGESER